MPRIDDVIDLMEEAKFISTLDMTKGYWQVPVRSEDRAKTAFATPFGLYQITRMQFGLQGAPATLQRMVDRLLEETGDFTNAYIDDVVIYSSSWEEHLVHLREILNRIPVQKAGLKVKPGKCQLGMTYCVYLGHVIGNGEIRPEMSKVKAVQDFKVPITKKAVQAFLGLTGYYRKFIPDYASIATVLTDLTRKSQPTKVQWTAECEAAFRRLKTALCSAPFLNSPAVRGLFYKQTHWREVWEPSSVSWIITP